MIESFIMKKVLVPFAEGFEEVEAVTIVDILRRGGVEVVTASLMGPLVTGAHGMRIEADSILSEVLEEEYDAIILPGGGKGTENLLECEPLKRRLQRQKADGKLVAAICAAPMVLDNAEVLSGEEVTCYPTCAPQMSCRVEDVPVIADGLVITGQAPGAALLFSLVVLKHLRSEVKAREVAAGLVTDVL